MDKQVRLCLHQNNKEGMGPVSDKEKEFQLKLEREGKARERMTIQALITAKQVRISTTKQTSVTTLNELSEVMYQQTNSTARCIKRCPARKRGRCSWKIFETINQTKP